VGGNDPSGGAAQRLADALRALHERAGRPTYASLVHRAARHSPLVTLRASTLSCWFSGKNVPVAGPAFDYLIESLERAAERRGHAPLGLAKWEQLRALAWNHARRDRGGRPAKAARRGGGGDRIDPPGRMVGELDESDALNLEVHRAIDSWADLPVLPQYLERPHDARLRQLVRRAGSGSRAVMVIGGSSTGKTRACWEAIRAELPGWRVWHPLTPDRPDAVVEALTRRRVEPRTVIWLNEAQLYLSPLPDGERVASALHELLQDTSAGPFLVLGSMWPEHWRDLTSDSVSGHDAARQFLWIVQDVTVPARFDADELARLGPTIDDPRLKLAVEKADGRVTQYLAGAYELVHRYERADEVAKAALWAAIDLRRLSRSRHVDEEFLRHAVAGYLDDVWEQADVLGARLPAALAYLAEPCHGVPGPLSPRRTARGEAASPSMEFRLADYIEELGRTTRRRICPPASFWDAAVATLTEPTVLIDLAQAAESRLRLRRAESLYRAAADCGHSLTPLELAWLRQRDGDDSAADRLAIYLTGEEHAAALVRLAGLQERAGRHEAAEKLAMQAVTEGDPSALVQLAWIRECAGDFVAAERLAEQAADNGDASVLVELAIMRGDDRESADHLYRQAAAAGEVSALSRQAWLLELAGERSAAERVAEQAAECGHRTMFVELCWAPEAIKDIGRVDELVGMAMRRGEISELFRQAWSKEQTGDYAAAEKSYLTGVERGDLNALLRLGALWDYRLGNKLGTEQLVMQAAENGRADLLVEIGWIREQAGCHDAAERFALKAVDYGDTRGLIRLAWRREVIGDYRGLQRLVRGAVDAGLLVAQTLLAKLLDEKERDELRRHGLSDEGWLGGPS
jgi:hypothetical protein